MTGSYQDWMEGPREPAAAEGCLHELVAAQAARTPGGVAVVGEGQALPYGGLEARADRLAQLLRAQGVGPEVPVGLCLGGAPARVVGLLAVLKAGGAFVPLDPGDPAERLAFLLADSGAPLVVAESRFAHLLPGALPTLLLDRPRAALAAPASRPPGPPELDPAAGRPRVGEPRLRHLRRGLDRPPQGGAGDARGGGQHGPRDRPPPRPHPRDPHVPGGVARLRRLGARDLLHPRRRRLPDPRPRGDPARRSRARAASGRGTGDHPVSGARPPRG